MRRLLLSLLALSALAACKKQDQGSGAPAANANGPIVIGVTDTPQQFDKIIHDETANLTEVFKEITN